MGCFTSSINTKNEITPKQEKEFKNKDLNQINENENKKNKLNTKT